MASAAAAPLPADWTGDDVGVPALTGNFSTAASGTLTLSAAGTGLAGVADQFYLVAGGLSGDGEIVARVGNQTNTNGGARAGVTLRASSAPDAPHLSLFLTPTAGLKLVCRTTAGGPSLTEGSGNTIKPIWLKVTRFGNAFSAYHSDHGNRWTQVGATYTIDLPANIKGGLAQASLSPNTRGAADYTGVSLTSFAAGTLPPSVATAVIGGPTTQGTATAHAGAGEYTLQTNGSAQGGVADDFVFLQMPFTGDGEFIARLRAIDSSSDWAKAGISVRTSLAPDAASFSINLAALAGLFLEHRLDDAASTKQLRRTTGRTVPLWMKITRRSIFYQAYTSGDGQSWTPLGQTVRLLSGPQVHFGLTLSSQSATALAAGHFDSVTWPQPAALPPVETDPVILTGLASWRKPDPSGVSCVDCHTPFGYDIAQFNFTLADVRLATTPHLAESDADAIFAMLEKYRERFPPVGGLKNFRTHRPMQPGGGQVIGGENASPDARDYAFGQYLESRFRLAQGRITNLTEARAAARELIDVNVASVPVGLKFNLWSRSVLREGAVAGGEIAEWLPSAGIVPKPEFATAWNALQDRYRRDPSNENFWALYEATGKWVQPDPHNFESGIVDSRWKLIVLGQYRANFLLAHDELLKARGLLSLLAAEGGVRPFPSVRNALTTSLSPFWEVGDGARIVENSGFEAMPRRNRESVHNNTSRNTNLTEVNGWQIHNLQNPWFWLGWMQDNSLRFSGQGSTLSGEYFIGSLWRGEVDDPLRGNSLSSHGFRFHQVFFNAVHHLKLGFKPGAWGEGEVDPQHFEANKGYYLGYNRWKPRAEPADPLLAGSGPLYRRLISNHLRMGLLIHADEAAARAGAYYNESYTLADISLWRQVLAWADPAWAVADEALFAQLRASLTTSLTADDLADPDGDGTSALIATALAIPAEGRFSNPSGEPFGERYGHSSTGQLTISFQRARADWTYVVEASPDLTNWLPIATNPGTAGETVTVTDTATPQAPRRFLRLSILKALP
jgi:hypothetical protein